MSPSQAFGTAARKILPARRSTRPGLRVVAGGPRRAPRAPFVVLVLLVLGVGLVGLLLLNTSLQEGTFGLTELRREVSDLQDREAALSERVAKLSSPADLARRARHLGMESAEDPDFLQLDRSEQPTSTEPEP